MTASESIYEILKSMDFGIISLYISVIFVNSSKGNIEEENYLKTAIQIDEEEKDRYAITNKSDECIAPFYSI